jgi:hypothetical protein
VEDGNKAIIHYHPKLLTEPDALAATFAHELSHYVLSSMEMSPGGEEMHEHATDCTAVFLGFGIFLANSARQFSQFQEGLMGGWSSSSSGYLSERSLVTATALFVRTFGHDPDIAERSLKPYLAKDFRKAIKHIDWKYPDLAGHLADPAASIWP